jgi:hypothetical protein
MPKEINAQADFDMRAARERLAQFQANSRRELDDEALNKQTERIREVQERYTPEVRQRIADSIGTGSIAAKTEVTNAFVKAAGIMVTKRPEYATGTRHRRLTEQARLCQTNEDLIGLAYDLIQHQKTDAEHIETWLSVLRPDILDLLNSAAAIPEAMLPSEMCARLNKYFYKGEGLPAEDRQIVASLMDKILPWQKGMLQMLLTLHMVNMHVRDDKEAGISESRGAPSRIDLRAGVEFVACSCDEHLGTCLLADQRDKKKPYTWFLHLCEEGFVKPLTSLLGRRSMVSPVTSVLYRRSRSNRE